MLLLRNYFNNGIPWFFHRLFRSSTNALLQIKWASNSFLTILLEWLVRYFLIPLDYWTVNVIDKIDSAFQSQTAVATYSGINILMSGVMPAANPIYSFDNALPPNITSCYQACTVLLNTSGVTLRYYRCNSTSFSNNQNYNKLNLNAYYPNCSSEIFSKF